MTIPVLFKCMSKYLVFAGHVFNLAFITVFQTALTFWSAYNGSLALWDWIAGKGKHRDQVTFEVLFKWSCANTTMVLILSILLFGSFYLLFTRADRYHQKHFRNGKKSS